MRALGIIFPWLLPALSRAAADDAKWSRLGTAPPVTDGRISGGMTPGQLVDACADMQRRIEALEAKIDNA